MLSGGSTFFFDSYCRHYDVTVRVDLDGDGKPDPVTLSECSFPLGGPPVSLFVAVHGHTVEGHLFPKQPKDRRRIVSFLFRQKDLVFKSESGKSFRVGDASTTNFPDPIQLIRVYLDLKHPSFIRKEAYVGGQWALLE